MVLPLLALAGAGASAAGGIGSALIGAQAQEDAMLYNYYVDIMNFNQRERERNEARDLTETIRREQKLGQTDADGNRTYFKEGVGWVTEQSDETAARDAVQDEITDLQLAEQKRILTQDVPLRRAKVHENYQASLAERDQANILYDQFRRIQRENPEAIRRKMVAAGSLGVHEGFDEAQALASRDAIRSGGNQTAKILAQLARERSDALSDLNVQADLQSELLADQRFDQDRSNAANLYNLFAQRASQLPEANYAPIQFNDNSAAANAQFASLLQQGNALGVQAASKKGGEYSFIEPNMGHANAAGAIGASVGGALRSAQGALSRSNATNSLQDYFRRQGFDDPYSSPSKTVRGTSGLF